MSDVTVRAAVEADLERIAAWQVAMARETEDKGLDGDVVRRGVERCFADPVKGRYLVAELDGRPVGSLLLTREWSDWRDGWFWWIQSVFVDASARGKGVYAALQGEVERQARAEPDVRGIRLYVELENEGARAVYAKLGLEETSYRFYETVF